MKRFVIYAVLLLLVISPLISACSGKDVEEKKRAIDKMTDHAAELAVEKIRTPTKQAEAARKLEDERVKKLDEALEEE